MNNSDWISIFSASITLLVGIIVALVGYLWARRERNVSTFMTDISKKMDDNTNSISGMSKDIAVLKKQAENHEKFTEKVLKPELDQVAEKVGEQAIEMAKMSKELVHLNEKVDKLSNGQYTRGGRFQ